MDGNLPGYRGRSFRENAQALLYEVETATGGRLYKWGRGRFFSP